MKGGEKLQLGMISSLRKMELASLSQGMSSEKIDAQFMLMLNALKTRPPQNESSQKDGQAKDGINQLLDILSSSADVSLMSNREDKMEVKALSYLIEDDQLSINLEHLITTYYTFSDREETLDLVVSNLDSILTNTFANLENKITQVLKNEMNTKIALDMFNQTELPVLLSDLKLLEHTANHLPDISVNEKITETVQDLQGLIVSINNFIESYESSTKKNVEKDTNSKAGYSFTNENNFIFGYNKLSSTKITVQKADKEQAENQLWVASNPNNGLENQKENSLSIKKSLLDSNSEETAISFIEAELMASKENRGNAVRFSTIDSKLLAIQNRVLLETRNLVGKEANTTNQKIDTLQSIQSNLFQGDNRLTEITTELKSIISSILSKLDKQPEGKSATVVQKVINPIMVSSLRKTGDIILPYVGMKEAVEGSQEDANINVLPSVQNSYIKQHPFVLLTDTGEMAQPKDVEEQFTKLLANSTFTKVGDMQKLSIRLAPDHLGSIRIEITQNEGNMIARIITANAEAKEALDKQLTSLKHGFTAQNLQVDKLDIVVSTPPQEKLQKEQQQQQEQQQSQSQREKKDADEDEKNRKSSFFEELLNMEI